MRRALLLTLISAFIIVPTAEARVIPGIRPAVRQSRRLLRAETKVKRIMEARSHVPAVTLEKKYENTEYGVSMRYPYHWIIDDTRQEEANLVFVVALFAPPKDAAVRSNANLVIENLEGTSAKSMTLNEYTAEGMRNVARVFDTFTILRSEPAVVAGKVAHRVVYRAMNNGLDMTLTQIWFPHRGNMHVWTYADRSETFEKSVGTFDAMLATLIVR